MCLNPLTSLHFRSLLWVGPALLFSTATAISVLGWDGKVRTILSISIPYAGQLLFLASVFIFFYNNNQFHLLVNEVSFLSSPGWSIE